jgi:hypothetical protein
MNTTVATAIDLLIALLNQTATISATIQKAQAENRTTLTDDEWSEIMVRDDLARAALESAIAKQTTSG